jgi:hypothetical protein
MDNKLTDNGSTDISQLARAADVSGLAARAASVDARLDALDARFEPAAGDKPWTELIPGIEACIQSGVIRLRGTASVARTSSSFVLCSLPPSWPASAEKGSYAVACREVGMAVRYGYISISDGARRIEFSPGGAVNEVTVSGISFPAAV